jgi:cyclic pyranopterin phosphate synthase
MPEEGVHLLTHDEVLSFEQIIEVVQVGVKWGIIKVRITGGEPLVRKGIVNLVANLGRIPGVEDLSMTTNAILLDDFADALKEAGLKRINISLDTLDPLRYGEITRGGDLNKVLKGIEAAQRVGFSPIKINCVIWKSADEPDALAVKEFCRRQGLEVRFIHQMNLNTGEFSVVEGGDGGNCSQCNRLRLTANGDLKPCLFNDIAFNIHEFGIDEAFRLAIDKKPKCGTYNNTGDFYNIGG